jgi:hypothetical protein
MKVVFADMDGLVTLVLPLLLAKPKISQSNQHEVFKTLKYGDIVLLGDKGLRSVEWSAFFPVNKIFYTFTEYNALLDGNEYVTFLNEHSESPFRLIITENNKTEINMLVVVDSFEYQKDKVGDINYTLKLQEYPDNADRL